ncbi:metallophosphoesterase [Blastopirellula marina]|uniref:Serine/threonine protein phosphatase n=1 Tax=Blastopirellula marina TaxID=124 RepID=A0A2S8GHX5_9BACT|nr:metallophosphoesterase [Blastopirellula marina]PQO44045.1 serine/threonine protein phosphatase [Blastopirellula marina]
MPKSAPFLTRRQFSAGLASLPLSLAAGSLLQGAELRPLDFPQDPAAGIREGWTIALFPDTQNYAKYAKNQAHFDRMCRWVEEHLDAWRIGLVMHEGDFVEQNNIAEGGGRGFGDQNSESQWTSAKRALRRLEDKVPTIYATGNHDYGQRIAESRETQFNDYFPLGGNKLISDGQGGGALIEMSENAFGQKTLENAAYELKLPGGRKLLVVSLEWGPRRESVAWAKQLVERPEYADHTGILLVHDFLTPQSIRDGQDGNRKRPGNPHTYQTGKEGNTHDGEDLWQALVREAPQFQMVLNGHEMGKHVGRRTDPNKSGDAVHQMLFNAQGLGGGSDERGNGGDGWLRLLTFEPDGVTLTVRTFSPLKLDAGVSPWWQHDDWSFVLPLKPV